jgi:UDP-4-amino-4-deoxy-L-arabinose-oxoglutarate aminotransferase
MTTMNRPGPTRETFLPFSRPDISETEIQAVAAVLRSGWITTGPRSAELETRFAERVEAPGAVALASATGGMHVVLAALGIGPGDEVITPSMTWVSTINLIVLAGATPVFVDVDRDTLMAGSEHFEAKITERTKAIIPVHYAGAAADMGPIREIAARHGITVIEDAAHAVGTEYRGEPIGKIGTSIFSFHPIKNITTGEGGIVCSDDEALLDRVRRLKFHGLGVDAFDRETQGRSPQAEVQEPGYKYNLTDIAAVLGLGQLARVDEFNRRRHELAMRYRELFSEVDEILPLADPPWPMTHAWHLFVIRLDSDRAGLDRDTFMAELKRRNIGTGIHFRAAHTHRYYRERFGFKPGDLPATEWSSDRMCSIPLFPSMTDDDVDTVVDAIKDVLAR